MNAQSILAIISGAKTILQEAITEGEKLFKSGEISAEDQAALMKERDSIIDGSAFTGPEWQPSTGSTPPTP